MTYKLESCTIFLEKMHDSAIESYKIVDASQINIILIVLSP